MPILNPSDSTEVLYGASGDVRNEINAYLETTTGAHYADEREVPGSLIISGLRSATRLINTFLEPVYADSIPFTAIADVPKFLDIVGNDLAVYYVFRSAHVLLGKMPDEKRQQYYDDYVDPKTGILTRLAEKKLGLAELTSITPAEAKSLLGSSAPFFGMDDETNYRVDPRIEEDTERERGR